MTTLSAHWLLGSAAVLALCAGTTGAAEAARARAADPAPKKAAAPKPQPQQAMLAVVSIANQRVQIYNAEGRVIATAPVSSGQSGYATPIGIFSVIQKDKFHRSNIYNDAPMPYMQRITWSGVALHEGNLPGHPASHGCIRLPGGFARQLWDMTRLGMRVVVTPRETGAHPIVHAGLPVPALLPSPIATAAAEPRPAGLIPVAFGDNTEPPAARPAGADATPAPARLLNPAERAQVLKLKAAGDLSAARRTAELAVATAKEKAEAARAVEATIRQVQRMIDESKSRLANLRAKSRADDADAIERAQGIEEMIADAVDELAAFKLSEATRLNETRTADDAVRAARLSILSAEAAIKDAQRRSEPVSVFVSRKEGKIFVRQAFEPIFEAPISIREPQRALGTHLYMATAAKDGGTALAWQSVTVPSRQGATAEPSGRSRRGRVEAPAPVGPPASASTALERFEMPEEARKFITERLWTGASLIISDEGISRETGKGTDFVILTR